MPSFARIDTLVSLARQSRVEKERPVTIDKDSFLWMLLECPGGTNQIGECILITIGHMIVLIQTRTRMDL